MHSRGQIESCLNDSKNQLAGRSSTRLDAMKRLALITSGNTSWLTLEPAKDVALFQSVIPEAYTVVVDKGRHTH